MRIARSFVVAFLAVELVDELFFGAREAAWPFLRADLGLSYAEVGLLLAVPSFTSTLVEPALGVLYDVWDRRAILLGGGCLFCLAMAAASLAGGFPSLLAAFVVLSPASGAFVGLGQASLMDADPARREQNMARWALAGSAGNVGGPLLLAACAALGVGWRPLFAALAAASALALAGAWRQPLGRARAAEVGPGLVEGLRGTARALRDRDVLRWAALLAFSDLVLDVFFGFLALYFVDVLGAAPAEAATAVAVWTGVGLAGDAALVPLLERVRGLTYLRASAALMLALVAAFLLVPAVWAKVAVLAAMGFFNSGWYAILKAKLYDALPGRGGAAMAAGNLVGAASGLFPLLIGVAAGRFGLGAAMWIVALGPVALLVGIPTREEGSATTDRGSGGG